MTDEPTNAELARGINRIERSVEALTIVVSTLPTKDIVALQQTNITQRVGELDGEIKRVALLTESNAAAIAAEREARRAAIEAEKARFGVWIRWILAGLATAIGSGLASLLSGRIS